MKAVGHQNSLTRCNFFGPKSAEVMNDFSTEFSMKTTNQHTRFWFLQQKKLTSIDFVKIR